jgi:hypothetical protein
MIHELNRFIPLRLRYPRAYSINLEPMYDFVR